MDNKNKKKRKVKKYHWLIVFSITIVFTMWLYGNIGYYLPNALYIGMGQYLDIGTGITITSLLVFGFIIGMIFKKNKNKRR